MTMRKNILCPGLILAGLVWLLVTPGPAFGQGQTWAGADLAGMIESARWRLGFLRVNAAFELRNVGYDSDVYYGYRAEPSPDYKFSAGAPVQVLIPVSKKIILDVFDNPEYVFYLDTQRERAWNNTFSGQVHFALNRVYVQAGGGLANNRRRMSPELEVNVRQKSDSLRGLVLWQASKGVALSVLYVGTKFDIGDAEYGGTNLGERLNRRENHFDLVAHLQASSRIRLSLDGKYGTYAFTEEAASLRDARSYGLFGGIEFVPKPGEGLSGVGLQGSISLGYMRFDLIDPQFVDGSGLSGEATISAQLMNRTTGRAFFSRGFQFSIYAGSTYYLSTDYGAGISRLLSQKISLSYDILFGSSSYPVSVTGGYEAPAGVRNRRLAHALSLQVRLARYLEITFLGSLGQRQGDAGGQVKSHYFVGFSLVYGFAGSGLSGLIGGLDR
jgi:hypothetical protein